MAIAMIAFALVAGADYPALSLVFGSAVGIGIGIVLLAWSRCGASGRQASYMAACACGFAGIAYGLVGFPVVRALILLWLCAAWVNYLMRADFGHG